MAFFLFVFAPAARALSPGAGARALDQGRRIFEILSWIAICALLLSGAVNLVVRWSAGGFSPGSPYGAILAIKLALFAAMLFHHSLQVFRYSPSIASLTTGAGPESEAWPPLLIAAWRKWFRLLKINAAIGPAVVLLGLALAGLSS
jgi:putative copper export protein